jgi:hypothetical protein
MPGVASAPQLLHHAASTDVRCAVWDGHRPCCSAAANCSAYHTWSCTNHSRIQCPANSPPYRLLTPTHGALPSCIPAWTISFDVMLIQHRQVLRVRSSHSESSPQICRPSSPGPIMWQGGCGCMHVSSSATWVEQVVNGNKQKNPCFMSLNEAHTCPLMMWKVSGTTRSYSLAKRWFPTLRWQEFTRLRAYEVRSMRAVESRCVSLVYVR